MVACTFDPLALRFILRRFRRACSVSSMKSKRSLPRDISLATKTRPGHRISRALCGRVDVLAQSVFHVLALGFGDSLYTTLAAKLIRSPRKSRIISRFAVTFIACHLRHSLHFDCICNIYAERLPVLPHLETSDRKLLISLAAKQPFT